MRLALEYNTRWGYWIMGGAVRNRHPLAYRMWLRLAPYAVRRKHTFYSQNLRRRQRKANRLAGGFNLDKFISRARRRQLRLHNMERKRKGWPKYKSYRIRQALRD